MELVIFARFHAREGQADAVAAAIGEVVPQTRAEPGCRIRCASSNVCGS